VIRAGTLIDGRSDAALRDQVIVVSGRRIESVGPAGTFQAPEGARTIDLSQATVLPGLIDSHTHLFLQGEEADEGGYDGQLLKRGIAYRAARATCRRGGRWSRASRPSATWRPRGAGYGDVELKQAIDEGHIPGPRIFASTRGISSTGGYPLEGLRAGDRGAQGRADRGRPGRGAQGRRGSSSRTAPTGSRST
jgi:imidazolonepropionase-like amidohydrolase